MNININNSGKSINQKNINLNKFKMALLFIQTKELKRKYYNKMELLPEQYRLVNRDWLNNFKNRYNYNEAIQYMDPFNDWSNYHDFKHKISKYLNINEDSISNDDIMNNNSQIKIEKYESKFEYPVDIELVNDQFFQDCKFGNIEFPICNVYLGDKTIFVIDDKRNQIAYNCSLSETQANAYNFIIQVNNILFFKDSNILNEQLNYIISERFNTYLSKRSININSKEQQKIIEPKNQKHVGYFINLLRENNNPNFQNKKLSQRNFSLNNHKNQYKINIFSEINRNNVNSNKNYNDLNKNNINQNYQRYYNQINNKNQCKFIIMVSN